MTPCSRHPQKGSVVLVVLCFLTVLGIGLAGYLAVSKQSMRLSNRSYVTGVGKQLAEMGLEQTLWAFNRNDWSSWTITGTTAKRTISFPGTKYGSSGLATSINLRVDNYNAFNLPSTWGAAVNYRVNDLVGYNGMWYRCVKPSSGQTPSGMGNLAYWVPAPISWIWLPNYPYETGDVINVYNGVNYRWYRCNTNHTSPASWTVTNWTLINSISLWNGAASYVSGDIVYFPSATTWYIWNGADWSSPPNISWQWKSATNYAFNDLVCVYDGGSSSYIWYRCILAHSNHTPPNSTYWENALSGSSVGTSGWGWNSSYAYNLNDVVYSGGSFYRCILAHTNQSPPNSTYWSTAPLKSTFWDSGRQYSLNEAVQYNGAWYLSLQNNNSGQFPPAASSTYWAIAPQSSSAWDSSRSYNVNEIVSNSGILYRCISAHTNQTPPNATYWAVTTGGAYQWNPATAYTASTSYCSYGGVWYQCQAGNTNQTPNNATYWSAVGAPVVYAEGAATMPDGASTKTQLRATVAPAPLFPNAAGSATTLNVSGGGTVDSYDASISAMSTGGIYSTYAKDQTSSPFSAGSPNLGYSAVLAAGLTSGTAITLGSTAVKGYAAAPSNSSAPYFPLFSSGGSVKGPLSPGSPNIDLSRLSRSPYIPKFDPQPAGGLTAAFAAGNFPKGTLLSLSTTLNIGTPGATTPSRYYYNSDLAIGVASSLTTLNINGPVILYINGDLTMDGSPNGLITITSTGSAEIHVADSLMVNINSDGVNNVTRDPKKLLVICDTAAASTQNYSDGTNQFYGVMYLPNTTNSSGLLVDNSNVELFGAVSAKKITYSGVDMKLHYDTSLRFATFGGVDQPYLIAEWRELTSATEKVTLP